MNFSVPIAICKYYKQDRLEAESQEEERHMCQSQDIIKAKQSHCVVTCKL
uniref:Uncharacterized protein n=1 Tax=Arion vulgaris TaxID=1028688 RepID=A0A0B7AXU6_9EUPU